MALQKSYGLFLLGLFIIQVHCMDEMVRTICKLILCKCKKIFVNYYFKLLYFIVGERENNQVTERDIDGRREG